MTFIEVLETNILHASDVIYWLDGSSAEANTDMARVPFPLQVQFSNKPRDVNIAHKAGKTACWRRPSNEIINGVATEEDKERPTELAFNLAGTVQDEKGRFNPRTFSVDVGNGSSPTLILYPTPAGTFFSSGGGINGTLRFAADESPVPWALLTLQVTIPGSSNQTYRAQADQHGDFRIALNRIPPLPEGEENYSAQLSIAALQTAQANQPLDVADLVTMNLEDLETAASFSNPIGLNVVPGEIVLIRSANKDHLAVQPIS